MKDHTMATWKYEFINPTPCSLHFAEGGFISVDHALERARRVLAVDRRWSDDSIVQERMSSAVRFLPRPASEMEVANYDLRLIAGEDGEQPILLHVRKES